MKNEILCALTIIACAALPWTIASWCTSSEQKAEMEKQQRQAEQEQAAQPTPTPTATFVLLTPLRDTGSSLAKMF